MIGIWLIRPEAIKLGEILKEKLNGTLFYSWKNKDISAKEQFQYNFSNHQKWILIMATGIAIRFLQGLVKNKKQDPAVVLVDEAGRNAISLLSGHEGGANQLAYEVANLLGATPVISTATESKKSLVLGLGCRKNASFSSIDDAIQAGLGQVNKSIYDLRELATVDLKSKELGIIQWCSKYSVPLRVIKLNQLKDRGWVRKKSIWVQDKIGVSGVCEPCALIASPRGTLILKKIKLNGVALALVKDQNAWN